MFGNSVKGSKALRNAYATYKTFNLHTGHKSDRKLDLQPTYKTLKQTYKTVEQNTRQ